MIPGWRRPCSITISKQRFENRALFLYAAITALILFRTLPFLLYGREIMDGDEGLFALMAKQLADGRAFPIFGFGSTYNFALSSWLAAPFIAVFGATAAAAKAPLLLFNLAVGNGTAYLLRRFARLSLGATFLCCLWFALPSFETSRGLMDNCIGGVEPFFFILIIWVLRKKPWLAGVIAGIGAVQRPYVLYAIPAIWLFSERAPGEVFARKIFAWTASTAMGMALIEALARVSSNYFGSRSPVRAKRLIFVLEDVRGYFAEIIPKTIGLQVQRLRPEVLVARDELAGSSHFNVAGLCLALLGVVLFAVALRFAWRKRTFLRTAFLENDDLRFPAYLLIVGILSFGAYVVAGPPSPDIRYTFLLLFGFVGAYALHAKLGSSKPLKTLAALFVLGSAANSFSADLKGWSDLVKLQRSHPQRELVDYLEKRGVKAALVDFASAYQIAYFSGERITVTDSISAGRIPANTRVYLHTEPERRAWVGFRPCGPATVKVANWYVCIPAQPVK